MGLNDVNSLLVILREYAPIIMVALTALTLKHHRTVHFLDLLFERLLQEESANRIAAEMDKAEVVSEAKEKGMRLEEALRCACRPTPGWR